MARYAFAFLCFVALTNVSLALIPEYQTIYVQNGNNLDFGTVEGDTDRDHIEACDIKFNNGSTYRLYPESKNEELNRKFYIRYLCRIEMYRVNEKDSGNWSVITTIKEKGKQPELKSASYEINIRKLMQEKQIVPTSRAWVYPGQQISAQFNGKFTNLKSCKILDPNQKEYDLGSKTSENIKLSGQCGFKMTVKKEYSGEWTLIADLNNNTAFYSKFNVLMKDARELDPKEVNLYFKKGELGLIYGGDELKTAKMCILEDPHGVKYPVQTGPCSREINPITEHHEGTWKAYYGLEGTEELVEQKISVRIYDTSPLNSTITRNADGNINLLCSVRSREMKFCSFIRPDGEVMHMTFGVGNGKYDYYGNGIHSHERYSTGIDTVTDCGLTIRNPKVRDYGSWRCVVRVGSTETLGRVLKVTPPAKSDINVKSVIKANDVYVKQGESYKIRCTTDEVLSYCWFRSPNGTVHTVVSGKNVKTPALEYEGTSLELGDCTARVYDANETHTGQWSCHLGIVDGPEVESNFKVIMKETHLMADSDTVVLGSTGESDLLCRPLPDSNKIIEACRWVNPTGRGINVDRHGHYFTETTTTHCRLSIRVVSNEDYGKWSCYARFAGSQEEGSTSISVTYSRGLGIGSFLSISLFVSFLVCASVSIFVLMVYRSRIAAARLDEKILTEKPSKYP